MIREEPAVAFAISSRPGCAYTEGGKVTGELFILKTTFSSSAFWGGTRNTDEKFFQISRLRAWDIFGACAATSLAELISGRRCTFRAMDRKPSTLVSAFLSCCQERGKNRETLRNFKLSLARISRPCLVLQRFLILPFDSKEFVCGTRVKIINEYFYSE